MRDLPREVTSKTANGRGTGPLAMRCRVGHPRAHRRRRRAGRGIFLLEAGAGQGIFDLSMRIDLIPVVVGVALGLVAVAFRLGERMQRDTEGLV